MAAAATPLLRSHGRVLIASADSSFRKRLMNSYCSVRALGEEAAGGAHALAKLAKVPCDSVVLDRNLPDLDSKEVAELIRRRYPQVEIEFVDSRSEDPIPTESDALEQTSDTGAAHLDEVSVEDRENGSDNMTPVQAFGIEQRAGALPGMIGGSASIQQVYRLARMVAPRDTAVLIVGDTGTGKELVAEAIHKLSPRATQPFVAVNCAAIPEALFEAELFGYARGAFTGAAQSRLGRIHVAQGGTLFLDEVGELPLSMQAKLLRFLQNGEVQRLGSSEVYRVDVRVVCATNVRLTDYVQMKQFRQDLYYRLAVFPIVLPPLRERADDIAELSAHFLERLSSENKVACRRLTSAALGLLRQSRWEGNVRELQHSIERAFILAGNESELRVEHFRSFGEAN
jgi:transcriptional regulator with GAF, ATPase, and Fis domain